MYPKINNNYQFSVGMYFHFILRNTDGSLALWKNSDAWRTVWVGITKSGVWTDTYPPPRKHFGTRWIK